MPRTTRRQALVTIAAGLSARSLARPQDYAPTVLTTEEHHILGFLVDTILPETETPGAREVGVHSMIDEDLQSESSSLGLLRNGLEELREAGFADMDSPERTRLLTRYSEADGNQREFFEVVKGLTIDCYYSTEVGLVQELGYQGNTYLQEFVGCTHDPEIGTGA